MQDKISIKELVHDELNIIRTYISSFSSSTAECLIEERMIKLCEKVKRASLEEASQEVMVDVIGISDNAAHIVQDLFHADDISCCAIKSSITGIGSDYILNIEE